MILDLRAFKTRNLVTLCAALRYFVLVAAAPIFPASP